MKRIIWLWLLVMMFVGVWYSKPANATVFTDLKFGQYQIADSQWNVSSCMYTTTCQIYSKNPGTAYKIPWTSGQISWASGDYIAFVATGDSTNPWNAIQYNSSGTQKAVMGTGHIINMGTDFFFFVGNDNNTGQMFSMTSGMNSTAGLTWTGTLNPTVAQVNTLASGGSTTPLAAGQTAGPPPPVPTPIYKQGTVSGAATYATRIVPTSNNSPTAEQSPNAFDNNPYTKYLNFDKYNAGVTIQLNAGRVVSGFTLTTANDYPGRDPTSYKLYGSNDGVNWTLVQQGNLSLSDTRYWTSPTTSVTNTNAYTYYYIFFPTTKAGDGCGLNCDSMQISEITYIYDANNTTTSTNTGTGTVTNPGSLCCGGSSAPFNANSNYVNMVNSFTGRTTNDSQVYIQQVGDGNIIEVNQSGTKNNYTYISNSGSNNNISVTQSGNASTQVNYSYNIINGNSNTVSITQTSTGGAKGSFVNVQDNNNSVVVSQTDSGSHYAEIGLSGGNKSVNVQQSGSASHMASIYLSGNPTSLTSQQSGTTQQFYSITFNCATAGGCAPITVKQGN